MQIVPGLKLSPTVSELRALLPQILVILLTGLGLAHGVSPARAAGTWTPLANKAPGGVSLMLLLSDGTIMCQNSGNAGWYRLTPDIHGSYVHGTWTTLAPMHDSRRYYSSQVLRDGRVFVAGGEYGTGGSHAEVYDPLSNTWTQAPDPGRNLIDAISETLPNGNVLEPSIATGSPCLVYNIVSNTWAHAATGYDGQDEAAWVKLPDESILTIDPFGQNTERYIPSQDIWVKDGTVPITMYGYGGELGPGFLLPNGQAFFIGATNHTAIYTPTGTTSAGVWTAGATIPNNLGAVDAPAAMLFNGNILCALGTNTSYGSVTYFYEYNYLSNTFTQVASPTGGTTDNVSPYGTTMLDLPDGTVLFSGHGSQLYNYAPAGSPVTNGIPAIASITTNRDDSFHVVGTLLNGISEGAAYGDDSQMTSGRPIARMTNGVNVLYCRTYDWSTCDVATGTNLLSTEMTLPAGLLPGTYPLVMTANGIASTPYLLTISGTPLPPVTGLVFSTIASNKMVLRWNAIGLTETGYVVQRSTDGVNYSTVATLAGTAYTDGVVTPLGQYYYRVAGTNSVGLGLLASPIFAASSSTQPMASPWAAGDVGTVLGSGASGSNAAVYTVIGSGAGIGADNDQFQFVYQPVVGDVTITARVTSSQNTGSNALAGVMIRNSLGNDVAGALMAFDSGMQTSVFEHRVDAAGLATYGMKLYGEPGEDADGLPSETGGGVAEKQFSARNVTAPLWVRLVRHGNVITGFTSSDGNTWIPEGSTTVVMSPVVYVGLAVSSGTYDLLNSSTFDNVTVSGTPALVPPPVAEWKLDETSGATAEDSIDSFDGLYNNVALGQPGATPATDLAAGFNGTNANISIPPLNLNSNVLTVTAWLKRNGSQNSWCGIFFDRESSTANGFHFGTANELRYTWNNNSSTYNWNSGLVVPDGQWTFVALVIEPTRARVYMAVNGVLVGATNNVANSVQGFAGNSCIGQDTTSGSRYFNGLLDNVAVYNQALTIGQLASLAVQPALAFSTPANGQEFLAPGEVELSAIASATNGHSINSVQFFNNGDLVGEFGNPPFAATVTNLPSGNYEFSARMYYDSGLEVDSDPVAVTVETVPAVPQGLVATALTSNLIFVTWSAAAGADGYILTRNGVSIAALGSSTNYYLDGSLVGGTTYCYTVTATNAVGNSPASGSNCATTPGSTITLAWDADGAGIGPQDGSGSWDGTSTTWWDGSANTVWSDGALAEFGSGVTTNCVVTLVNNIAASGIIFNQASGGLYSITNGGGTINLAGTITLVTLGDGTINATLKGAGQLVKSGPGTLTLTAANTNSGPVLVSGGELVATASPWYSPRSIGSGALTVNNGAIVEFTGTHGFGADASGRSATLSNGGTLQFDHENYVSGLTMTAGAIVGTGEIRTPGNVTYTVSAASSPTVISVPVNLVSGTATFNVAKGGSSMDLLDTGDNHGGHGFNKSGPGVMVMNGNSTYTGVTSVNAGTLQLDGSLGTNTVSVAKNATLSGAGVINGATTISSGGTLAPGDDGLGTLLFSSKLTLSSGSKTLLELSKESNGNLYNDLVSVLGTMTLGGTLTVTNIGTNALAAGDSFNLLDSMSFGGNFSSVTLPPLGSGLVWDASQLAASGVIAVVAQSVTNSPPIMARITNSVAGGGNGFALSGIGGAGQTYVLFGASNLIPPVAWVPVQTNQADTNGFFYFDDGQATNYSERFYRVVAP